MTEGLSKDIIIYSGQLGYLLNFGDELMKDGISRILNGHVE